MTRFKLRKRVIKINLKITVKPHTPTKSQKDLAKIDGVVFARWDTICDGQSDGWKDRRIYRWMHMLLTLTGGDIIEPRHVISNNVVCATSKASDTQSLQYSMTVKLLTVHHLEFLSLKGSCTGSSESTLVKMPHCLKSHVTAQLK